MLVDICLPVYNEEVILEKNTLRLYDFCRRQNFAFSWQIIIAINGSTDNSPDIAHRLQEHYPEIIVQTIENPGKGRAIKEAWSASEAEIVCFMDSDLAVEVEALPLLLNPLLNNEADITIGSRFLPYSQVRRSLLRKMTSRIYNFLARRFLGHRHHDLQCGFKAIRRPAFMKLLPYLTNPRWFFDTELVIWGDFFHYTVKEIPVNWQESRFQARASKVKLLKDSWTFIKNLRQLRKKLRQTSVHNLL